MNLAMVPQSVPPHPGSSSPTLSTKMSKFRRRDTQPELALRSALFAAGLRYRVAFPVPGQRRRTIDIAFPRKRVAVFVDGCFWHGCLEHGNRPRANSEWWRRKITANQTRDRDTDRVLGQIGWTPIRVWEHESASAAATKVIKELALRLVTSDSTAQTAESDHDAE
jgi:DNA mismatch endonuclease (patch repair protein)